MKRFLFSCTSLIVACACLGQQAGAVPLQVKKAPPKPKPLTFLNFTVGKKAGAMTVASITPFLSRQKISLKNAQIQLNGKVAVTGKYAYTTQGMFTGYCLSDLGKNSKAALPVAKGDTRTPGFCFRNEGAVRAALGKVGIATMYVDQYGINLTPAGELPNMARFVKLIKK